jgi:hypothetical protein
VIVLAPLTLLIVVLLVASSPAGSKRGRGCRWFWAWTGFGALITMGSISFVGVLLLPVAAFVAVPLAWRSPHAAEQTGLAAGAGAVLLYVGYVNRGPEHLDATPWFLTGLLLSAAAIATYTIAGHRVGVRPR